MPGQSTRYEWPEGRQMAAALMQRHPEVFKAVPPLSDILFVMDKESTPKSKGHPVGAQVTKIPAKFDDFLDAGDKLFMLEWFHYNTETMTRNQRNLLMAHELLHFEYDEKSGEHKLRGHDVEEFYLIADRFGLHWADETHGDVPDIMAIDFEWGKVGQARLNFAAGDKPANVPALTANLVDLVGLDGAKAITAMLKTDQGREALSEIVHQARMAEVERLTQKGMEAIDAMIADNVDEIAKGVAATAPPGTEITITAGDKSATAKAESGQPSDWQPDNPYVAKGNVVPFPGPKPTGPVN